MDDEAKRGGPAPAAAAPDPRSRLQLLRDVRAHHEARAAAYSRFEKAHAAYLYDRDAAAFGRRCAEATAEFQAVGRRVRAAADALGALPGGAGREDARLVRRLQELERDKLQLTAARQALGDRYVVGMGEPHHPDYVRDERDVRETMGAVVTDILGVVEELRYAELEAEEEAR